MKQYDAIIIGFGKGGKTLAAELAKRKLDVAVVERSEKMYGGTCINIGCIPTKTLVHAAKHADKDASWEVKKAYYRQSIARKEEVVSFLRQKNYHNLADNPHITVYTGYRLLCRSGCGGSWDGGRDITIASSPDIHQYGCRNRHSTDRGDTR